MVDSSRGLFFSPCADGTPTHINGENNKYPNKLITRQAGIRLNYPYSSQGMAMPAGAPGNRLPEMNHHRK